MRSRWTLAASGGSGGRYSLRAFLICTTFLSAWFGLRAQSVHDSETAIESIRDTGAEVIVYNGSPLGAGGLMVASTGSTSNLFAVCFRPSNEISIDLRGVSFEAGKWIERAALTDAKLIELWPVMSQIDGLCDLNLSSNPITSAGLCGIDLLDDLEHLHLFGTHVDDAGLAYLESLSNLEFVDVHSTRVTLNGVARLKATLPNCVILFDLSPPTLSDFDEKLVVTTP